MRFLEKMFESLQGEDPVMQPAAPASREQLMRQRGALNSALTPENQAKLARAYAVKEARNRINQTLKTEDGGEALVEIIRSLMRQK